jgi:hypothetical protein
VTHAPAQLGGVSQRAEQLRVALEKRHDGRVWNLPRGEEDSGAGLTRARRLTAHHSQLAGTGPTCRICDFVCTIASDTAACTCAVVETNHQLRPALAKRSSSLIGRSIAASQHLQGDRARPSPLLRWARTGTLPALLHRPSVWDAQHALPQLSLQVPAFSCGAIGVAL